MSAPPPSSETIYETRTTVLAAVLLAAGLLFHGHRIEGYSVVFQIADASRAAELVSAYLGGTLQVNAKKFIESLNALRDLVRSAKGGQR